MKHRLLKYTRLHISNAIKDVATNDKDLATITTLERESNQNNAHCPHVNIIQENTDGPKRGGKFLKCSCFHAHEKVRLDVSSRIRFSLLIFLSFILRFWNQIFTCLSVRLTLLLISRRRSRVRYMLNKNSFSNSKVWYFVYGHLFFLPLFAVNQLLVGVLFLDSAKQKDTVNQQQNKKGN